MNDLGLHHEWMLLNLRNTEGTDHSEYFIAQTALAGAAFAELEQRGRLRAFAADSYGLCEGHPSVGALGVAEERLQGKQWSLDKALTRLCVGFLSNPYLNLRTATLHELVVRGALAPATDRFMRVPWRTRHPTADAHFEQAIIRRIRLHVLVADRTTPPGRDDVLLSLLRASHLLHTVWSPAELLHHRSRINARTDLAPLGIAVRDLRRNLQTANMVPTS